MTELFVGVRDGYVAARVPNVPMPDYVRGERTERTGEDLYRDFAHLVRRGDH